MKWKTKSLFLLLVSVPAFSGYPVNLWDYEIISGLRFGWMIYFIGANLSVWLVTGNRFYANVLSAAALISLPVVYGGAFISYLFFIAGAGKELDQAIYSAHYISLCLTMLTVIPLAIAMVALVPFQSIEKSLLTRENGVSKIEKFLLMFLRVFNHILFWVIPNIMEVIREERPFEIGRAASTAAADGLISTLWYRNLKHRSRAIIKVMTYLSVEGISAAIQYVPLWAVEISLLPGKSESRLRRITCRSSRK